MSLVDQPQECPTIESVERTITYRARNEPLHDLYDAKRRNRDVGGHYFDPDTIRFHAARYGAQRALPDGSLLVVESTEWRGHVAREWRVIRIRRDGEVERLTEMGGSAKARRDIERLYQLAWCGRAFGALVCAGVR